MSVEAAGFQQILRHTAQTVSCQFYQDGEPADPGTVTVTITDVDGHPVVEDAATSGSGMNPRTYELAPAQTAMLGLLTLVWTSAGDGDFAPHTEVTTHAEVVGDLLFTLAEARAFDGGALGDVSTETLITYRAMIGDAFALRCGVSFYPRYKRAVLDGTGSCDLLLPDLYLRAVASIETREPGSTTWTAFSAEDLADVIVESWGRISRETRGWFPAGRQNVRVGYEYGMGRVPLEINRAALLVLRDVALKSNIDDRATSFTDEFGSRTFVVTPGIRGALYAIPEVNAILNQYSERVPAIR